MIYSIVSLNDRSVGTSVACPASGARGRVGARQLPWNNGPASRLIDNLS